MRTCKAKGCRNKFEPKSPSQIVCSYSCVKAYQRTQLNKKQKEQRKQMKVNIKTYSDWLKELQVLVNTYVRIRDKAKECISCGNPLRGKFDAGHYLAQGNYPSVRFDLRNIQGQCVRCNRDLHGNLIEYGKRLRIRIGLKEYDRLMIQRLEPSKLSIPEIEQLKAEYKAKIKEL